MTVLPSMLPAWQEAAKREAAHKAVDEHYSTPSPLSAEQHAAALKVAHDAVNAQFAPTPHTPSTPMTPEERKKFLRFWAAALIVAYAISAGFYFTRDTSVPEVKPIPETSSLEQQSYRVPHGTRAALMAANMLNAKPAAFSDIFLTDASPNKNENPAAALLGVSEESLSALFPDSTKPAGPATVATIAAHEAPSPVF